MIRRALFSYFSLQRVSRPVFGHCRCYSEARKLSDGEQKITETLKANFPKATIVLVEDISGGCGAMYDIKIESMEFAGVRKVKQHMMVNEALKKEIKDMHGLRINTLVPES